MKFDLVDFNTDFILSFNTCEEFINHAGNGHLWPGISDDQRKKKLTELYFLVNPKKKQSLKKRLA